MSPEEAHGRRVRVRSCRSRPREAVDKLAQPRRADCVANSRCHAGHSLARGVALASGRLGGGASAAMRSEQLILDGDGRRPCGRIPCTDVFESAATP
jgi:hypothetical protein